MKVRERAAPALAVLVALTAVAHAAPPSQENLARSHYVAGEEEYARGRWQEALHEFQIGYSLSPRPEFLINFAQVYRKLGDYDRAITECERYLATGPEASLAAQAQRLLQQLREEKQHAAPAKVAPAVTPPANNATNNATNNVSQPPLALTAPATPPAKRSRRWIAPVVAVAAVLVAGGIVVGIVLGTQPRDTFKPAPLGTVDFR
jgi:tetratricopeptide (TPR) repeat protein